MDATALTTRKPSTRINELDGLRGILALWVAVIHIISWCGMAPMAFDIPATAKRLWNESAQGAVDVFIILSGFVITCLLCTRQQSYRQFMAGRFFRIYPVYLFCLLLGWFTIGYASFMLNNVPWHGRPYFQEWLAPTVLAETAQPLSHMLAHLTLLFGVIPEKIMPCASYTILGPAWSITLEWQYYLLAPLIAYMVISRRGLLLLGLIGACDFIFTHFWSSSFLPLKLPLFLVGIGSYHLYTYSPRWKLAPGFITLSVVMTFAAVIAISWHWMAMGVWTLVLGCLLLGEEDGLSHDFFRQRLVGLRRMLLNPVLQWLGNISYPLYLIHWPLIIFLLIGILNIKSDITPFAAVAIMLAAGLPVILLAAWLLHKTIEAPLMRYGRKFTH